MRWTQLLCMIGLTLWSGIAAGSQATNTGPLPAALRTHLQAERFQIVTAVRGLPLGVRDTLQALFGSGGLDIVDPGAPFQLTNVAANPKLPTRRLVAAGCSNDHHCLVYYERGGTDHTWQVMLFQWSPSETRLEWGNLAPGGLATIEDVQKAILSGQMKGAPKSW